MRTSKLLVGVLSMLTLIGCFLLAQPASANQVSPLITSYQPKLKTSTYTTTYTDSNGNTQPVTITHPGITMSVDQLETMQKQVRAGVEPWATAFNAYTRDSFASKSPRIYFQWWNDIFIHILGPWAVTGYANPSEYVGDRVNKDGATIFKQTMMWYITGDITYRKNAMDTIRRYEKIQSALSAYNFRFATLTYWLAASAEILRATDCQDPTLDWTQDDTDNLTRVFNVLSVTYNAHSYWMNQHQFNVMGTMGRALFTNDYPLYAQAVEATTVNNAGAHGGHNGSIMYQMRLMTKNEQTGEEIPPAEQQVQLIEMGRDVGHAWDDVGGLSTLAQTIYSQGTKVDPVNGTISTQANAVNPFNFLDDRILAGTTYLICYEKGENLPWIPADSSRGIYTQPNPADRGRIDGLLGILYNYYKYDEGADMSADKYKPLTDAYEAMMPEGTSTDYPAAGTLLFTRDKTRAQPVTITYQTASGTKLHDPQIIKGYVGDAYDASVDQYKLAINGYTLTKLPDNVKGTLSSTPQTVSYVYSANVVPNGGGGNNSGNLPNSTPSSTAPASSSSASSIPSQPISPSPVPKTKFKPFKIYSRKPIYRYRTVNFTKKNRLKYYPEKPLINAPVFTVVKTARSSNGHLRYQLADGSFVTAKSGYTAKLYWQKRHAFIKVVGPQGVYEYSGKSFNVKQRLKKLKKGTVIPVRGLVQYGLTTRFLLTNGHYVTGSKQYVAISH
ncbi:DUF5776 domain-containing protein [uncultured Lentilactobacillus sp.]|nr:DUF5776 domain-containing protein [uncultured Lentilactobacillus sp.]